MRKINIPKKTKGQFRTIYVPNPLEMEALRKLLPELHSYAAEFCDLNICQGFLPQTSPVTNANCHVGYQYTTIIDLKDFFDSITVNHLQFFDDNLLESILIDGAPRQGLPTSPIVANIAAIAMDTDISSWILDNKFNIKYTRYADDLCFSYNDYSIKDSLIEAITNIVTSHKFAVNPKKTRTLSAKNGRRIITGVAVDNDIHPTRRMKRKARAALYKGKINQHQGLKEWCKVKLPRKLENEKTEQARIDFTNMLDRATNSAYNPRFTDLKSFTEG